MALKLRFDAQAEQDLREIRNYLLRDAGVAAADRVRKHLRQRIQRLCRFPLIGTPTTDDTIRILPPLRYPYRIYYAISDEAVVVLHIRHTARLEPEDMPKRRG